MKERIVVEYGEVNKIAELMGCTNVMVSHALERKGYAFEQLQY